MAVIAIIVTCAGVAALFFGRVRGISYDPHATRGALPEEVLSEPRSSFSRMTDSIMQTASMASSVAMSFSDSVAPLRIQNAADSQYPIQVVIVRNDTAKAIYRSGVVEPNSYIDRAPLDILLDPGTYACTANFFAIDPFTKQKVAQAAAPIKITVLGSSQATDHVREDIALAENEKQILGDCTNVRDTTGLLEKINRKCTRCSMFVKPDCVMMT